MFIELARDRDRQAQDRQTGEIYLASDDERQAAIFLHKNKRDYVFYPRVFSLENYLVRNDYCNFSESIGNKHIKEFYFFVNSKRWGYLFICYDFKIYDINLWADVEPKPWERKYYALMVSDVYIILQKHKDYNLGGNVILSSKTKTKVEVTPIDSSSRIYPPETIRFSPGNKRMFLLDLYAVSEYSKIYVMCYLIYAQIYSQTSSIRESNSYTYVIQNKIKIKETETLRIELMLKYNYANVDNIEEYNPLLLPRVSERLLPSNTQLVFIHDDIPMAYLSPPYATIRKISGGVDGIRNIFGVCAANFILLFYTVFISKKQLYENKNYVVYYAYSIPNFEYKIKTAIHEDHEDLYHNIEDLSYALLNLQDEFLIFRANNLNMLGVYNGLHPYDEMTYKEIKQHAILEFEADGGSIVSLSIAPPVFLERIYYADNLDERVDPNIFMVFIEKKYENIQPKYYIVMGRRHGFIAIVKSMSHSITNTLDKMIEIGLKRTYLPFGDENIKDIYKKYYDVKKIFWAKVSLEFGRKEKATIIIKVNDIEYGAELLLIMSFYDSYSGEAYYEILGKIIELSYFYVYNGSTISLNLKANEPDDYSFHTTEIYNDKLKLHIIDIHSVSSQKYVYVNLFLLAP